MAKVSDPLQSKRIPKSASSPTETAESAVSPAPKSAAPAAKKGKPAAPVSAAPVVAEQPAVKATKSHKPKLVRDSFTIPKDEYQVLESLKTRALDLGQHARKSELLRAGIRALQAMNDRAFLKAVGAVPTLKTGRPKSA
jgi:hypothetical protein